MVSQHAKEDVGLCPILQMMENRPLHERTFNVAEGIFHSSEQNIGAPDFIRCQILSIGFENITAVEFLGDRLFVGEFFPGQVLIGGIVGDLVITCHARIALLQSADRRSAIRAWHVITRSPTMPPIRTWPGKNSPTKRRSPKNSTAVMFSKPIDRI